MNQPIISPAKDVCQECGDTELYWCGLCVACFIEMNFDSSTIGETERENARVD